MSTDFSDLIERARGGSRERVPAIHYPEGSYQSTSRVGDPRDGGRRRHEGHDMVLSTDDVTLPYEGRVVEAGPRGGYGNQIVVDHGRDREGRRITTRYAHLDEIGVRAGERLRRGHRLGRQGATGNVRRSRGGSGKHLHFEVRADDSPLDPTSYYFEGLTLDADGAPSSGAPDFTELARRATTQTVEATRRSLPDFGIRRAPDPLGVESDGPVTADGRRPPRAEFPLSEGIARRLNEGVPREAQLAPEDVLPGAAERNARDHSIRRPAVEDPEGKLTITTPDGYKPAFVAGIGPVPGLVVVREDGKPIDYTADGKQQGAQPQGAGVSLRRAPLPREQAERIEYSDPTRGLVAEVRQRERVQWGSPDPSFRERQRAEGRNPDVFFDDIDRMRQVLTKDDPFQRKGVEKPVVDGPPRAVSRADAYVSEPELYPTGVKRHLRVPIPLDERYVTVDLVQRQFYKILGLIRDDADYEKAKASGKLPIRFTLYDADGREQPVDDHTLQQMLAEAKQNQQIDASNFDMLEREAKRRELTDEERAEYARLKNRRGIGYAKHPTTGAEIGMVDAGGNLRYAIAEDLIAEAEGFKELPGLAGEPYTTAEILANPAVRASDDWYKEKFKDPAARMRDAYQKGDYGTIASEVGSALWDAAKPSSNPLIDTPNRIAQGLEQTPADIALSRGERQGETPILGSNYARGLLSAPGAAVEGLTLGTFKGPRFDPLKGQSRASELVAQIFPELVQAGFEMPWWFAGPGPVTAAGRAAKVGFEGIKGAERLQKFERAQRAIAAIERAGERGVALLERNPELVASLRLAATGGGIEALKGQQPGESFGDYLARVGSVSATLGLVRPLMRFVPHEIPIGRGKTIRLDNDFREEVAGVFASSLVQIASGGQSQRFQFSDNPDINFGLNIAFDVVSGWLVEKRAEGMIHGNRGPILVESDRPGTSAATRGEPGALATSGGGERFYGLYDPETGRYEPITADEAVKLRYQANRKLAPEERNQPGKGVHVERVPFVQYQAMFPHGDMGTRSDLTRAARAKFEADLAGQPFGMEEALDTFERADFLEPGPPGAASLARPTGAPAAPPAVDPALDGAPAAELDPARPAALNPSSAVPVEPTDLSRGRELPPASVRGLLAASDAAAVEIPERGEIQAGDDPGRYRTPTDVDKGNSDERPRIVYRRGPRGIEFGFRVGLGDEVYTTGADGQPVAVADDETWRKVSASQMQNFKRGLEHGDQNARRLYDMTQRAGEIIRTARERGFTAEVPGERRGQVVDGAVPRTREGADGPPPYPNTATTDFDVSATAEPEQRGFAIVGGGTVPRNQGGSPYARVTNASLGRGNTATSPEGQRFQHGSTQIQAPAEVAERVRSVAASIPDDALAGKGRETEPHVTVFWGLEEPEVLEPLRQLAARTAPFTVKLGKTSLFPPSESSDNAAVVKVDVESESLRQLNRMIDADPSIRTKASEFEYAPHLTIAYVKPERAHVFQGRSDLEGQEIRVDAIYVSDRDGQKIRIPLGTGIATKTAASDTADKEGTDGGSDAEERFWRGVREPRRPSLPTVRGEATTVDVPRENTEIPSRYEVWDLRDLHPSHSGIDFRPNPAYYYENDRRYDQSKDAQKRVMDQAQPFNPRYFINDTNTAENGPSVVDPDGNALGGNSRLMTLQRIYDAGDERAAAYKKLLVDRAHVFGLDRAAVAKVARPVLVRVVDPAWLGGASSSRAITDLNKTGTARLSEEENAIAKARNISQEALDYLTGEIERHGEDGTLAKALEADPHGIVNRLIEDGIFTETERQQLYTKEGKASDYAKDQILDILVGKAVRDFDQLNRLSPGTKQRVERIAARLAAHEGRADVRSWSIKALFAEALDALEESRARGMKLDELNQTPDMLNPHVYTDESLALARTIQRGPVVAAKAFTAYFNEAKKSATGEGGGLFGSMSREQAFEEFFGVRPSPDVFPSQANASGTKGVVGEDAFESVEGSKLSKDDLLKRTGTDDDDGGQTKAVEGFFSAAESVLDRLFRESKQIKAAALVKELKRYGVTDAEIEDLGIASLVKDAGGERLTAEDVLATIAANELVLEEVKLSYNARQRFNDLRRHVDALDRLARRALIERRTGTPWTGTDGELETWARDLTTAIRHGKKVPPEYADLPEIANMQRANARLAETRPERDRAIEEARKDLKKRFLSADDVAYHLLSDEDDPEYGHRVERWEAKKFDYRIRITTDHYGGDEGTWHSVVLEDIQGDRDDEELGPYRSMDEAKEAVARFLNMLMEQQEEHDAEHVGGGWESIVTGRREGEPVYHEEASTDGATNYREFLFKWPRLVGSEWAGRHFGSHADELLANAIVQERYVNGRRYLDITEIQSDLHQAGKKFGYRGHESSLRHEANRVNDELRRVNMEQLAELAEVGRSAWRVDGRPLGPSEIGRARETGREVLRAIEDGATPETMLDDEGLAALKRHDDLAAKAQKLADRNHELSQKMLDADRRAPDAPLKEHYELFVLKRLMKLAAEEGYDGVLVTAGAVNAEKYGLDRQFHSLTYYRARDGNWHIRIKRHAHDPSRKLTISDDQLEEAVGKKTAGHMRSNHGRVDRDAEKLKDERGEPLPVQKILSGELLEMEKRGMRVAYDERLPGLLKRLARNRKWDATVTTEKVRIDWNRTHYDGPNETTPEEFAARRAEVVAALSKHFASESKDVQTRYEAMLENMQGGMTLRGAINDGLKQFTTKLDPEAFDAVARLFGGRVTPRVLDYDYAALEITPKMVEDLKEPFPLYAKADMSARELRPGSWEVTRGEKYLGAFPAASAEEAIGKAAKLFKGSDERREQKAASARDAARSTRVRYWAPRHDYAAPVIELDRRTAALVQQLADGGELDWLGSSFSNRHGLLHQAAVGLRGLADTLPKGEATRLRALADQIDRAVRDAKVGSVTLVLSRDEIASSPAGRNGVRVEDIIRHEQSHAIQRMLSRLFTDGESEDYFVPYGTLEKIPGLDPVVERLQAKYGLRNPGVVAMEVFTHLATSPDVGYLGVDRAEAVRLLRGFFEVIYETHGEQMTELLSETLSDIGREADDATRQARRARSRDTEDGRQPQAADGRVSRREADGQEGGARPGLRRDDGARAEEDGQLKAVDFSRAQAVRVGRRGEHYLVTAPAGPVRYSFLGKGTRVADVIRRIKGIAADLASSRPALSGRDPFQREWSYRYQAPTRPLESPVVYVNHAVMHALVTADARRKVPIHVPVGVSAPLDYTGEIAWRLVEAAERGGPTAARNVEGFLEVLRTAFDAADSADANISFVATEAAPARGLVYPLQEWLIKQTINHEQTHSLQDYLSRLFGGVTGKYFIPESYREDLLANPAVAEVVAKLKRIGYEGVSDDGLMMEIFTHLATDDETDLLDQLSLSADTATEILTAFYEVIYDVHGERGADLFDAYVEEHARRAKEQAHAKRQTLDYVFERLDAAIARLEASVGSGGQAAAESRPGNEESQADVRGVSRGEADGQEGRASARGRAGSGRAEPRYALRLGRQKPAPDPKMERILQEQDAHLNPPWTDRVKELPTKSRERLQRFTMHFVNSLAFTDSYVKEVERRVGQIDAADNPLVLSHVVMGGRATGRAERAAIILHKLRKVARKEGLEREVTQILNYDNYERAWEIVRQDRSKALHEFSHEAVRLVPEEAWIRIAGKQYRRRIGNQVVPVGPVLTEAQLSDILRVKRQGGTLADATKDAIYQIPKDTFKPYVAGKQRGKTEIDYAAKEAFVLSLVDRVPRGLWAALNRTHSKTKGGPVISDAELQELLGYSTVQRGPLSRPLVETIFALKKNAFGRFAGEGPKYPLTHHQYDEIQRLWDEAHRTVGPEHVGTKDHTAMKLAPWERFSGVWDDAHRKIREFDDRLARGDVAPLSETEIEEGRRLLRNELGADRFRRASAIAYKVYDLPREALRELHRTGIISRATLDSLLNRGRAYAPLWRIQQITDAVKESSAPDASKLYLQQQEVLFKLKGSKATNVDPWWALQMHLTEAYKEAGRNEVARSLVNLRLIDPETAAEVVEVAPGQKRPSGSSLLPVYENGTKKQYAVPPVWKETLDLVSVGVPSKYGVMFLRAAGNTLRALTTGANLAWTVMNLPRDIERAHRLHPAINLKPAELTYETRTAQGASGPTTVSRVNGVRTGPLLQATLGWVRAFISVVSEDKAYQEFLAEGAAYSTIQKAIDPRLFVVDRYYWERVRRNPLNLLNPKALVLDNIAKFNNFLEESTKLMAYNVGRRAGLTPLESAFAARNWGGSPDFALGGSYAPIMNLLVPFFRATTNGIRADLQWMANTVPGLGRVAPGLATDVTAGIGLTPPPPGKGTGSAAEDAEGKNVRRARAGQVWRYAAGLTGLVFFWLWWNLQFELEDDEGNRVKEIDLVTRSDRSRYLVVLTPITYTDDEGRTRHLAVRFPKDQGIGMLWDPIEQALRGALFDGKTDFGEVALDTAARVVPGSFEFRKGKLFEDTFRGMVASLNPAIAAPVELGMNWEAFRNRAIVNPRLADKVPAEQYVEGQTSETAKAAARGAQKVIDALNEVLPPDYRFLPNQSFVVNSPRKIEYLVSRATGGFGEEAMKLSDQLFHGQSHEQIVTSTADELKRTFVLGRYIASDTDQARIDRIDNFYDDYEAAASVYRTFVSTASEDPERARKLLESPETLRYAAYAGELAQLQREMSKIGDAVRRVAASDAPDEERRKTFEALKRAETGLLRRAGEIRRAIRETSAEETAADPKVKLFVYNTEVEYEKSAAVKKIVENAAFRQMDYAAQSKALSSVEALFNAVRTEEFDPLMDKPEEVATRIRKFIVLRTGFVEVDGRKMPLELYVLGPKKKR
jgi:2'-5' RNA ligase